MNNKVPSPDRSIQAILSTCKETLQEFDERIEKIIQENPDRIVWEDVKNALLLEELLFTLNETLLLAKEKTPETEANTNENKHGQEKKPLTANTEKPNPHLNTDTVGLRHPFLYRKKDDTTH